MFNTAFSAAYSKWESSLFDQFYTDKKTDGSPRKDCPACYESVVISYGIVNLPHGLKLSRLFGGLTLQR